MPSLSKELDEFRSASCAGEVEPLKIGLYSPALPGSGFNSGIVTYIRIMRDALRALGHAVVVVTLDAIENSDGQVSELPKPSPLVGGIRMMLEARREQDSTHPSIRLRIIDAFRAARRVGVEVFEMEESFGWAGRLAGHQVAIVERLHGPHVFVRDEIESCEEQRRGDLREAAEFASFAKVQAVTAPSKRLIECLIPYGLDPSIAYAIPNPMPAVRPADIWQMSRANSDQILFVGRFDLCKGADVAIRAFAHALSRRPSLNLTMVGPDHGINSREGRVHFDEFVMRNMPENVRERITYLGEQNSERIAQLRLQSGLALVASRFETSSYVLAEAMACGMPVLATDCVGPSGIIQDRATGRIVPVADAVAMGDAMEEMTADPVGSAQMGKLAHAWVTDRLSPKRIAAETVAVYREAIRLR